MKLFIAVHFSNNIKTRLAALRDELRIKSAHGKFSMTENLHLTLVFLDECDARQLAAAKTVLDTMRIEPMELCVDCIGRFHRDGGDIWWAGVRGNKVLGALQQGLDEKLISAGFRLENRKYSPHITLAREVFTETHPWPIELFGETVRSVELMKSERIQGKLTYTAIHQRMTET